MPALDYFFLSFGTNVPSVSSQYAWYFPPTTIILSWKFTFLAPTCRNPHSPAVFEFPCLKLISGPDSWRCMTRTWAGKDNPQKTQSTLSTVTQSYMASSCLCSTSKGRDVHRAIGVIDLWHQRLRVCRTKERQQMQL